MRKLKIQQDDILDVKNIDFEVDGTLQIAKNFINLSKAYLKKDNNSSRPRYFTFYGLPEKFALCLKLGINFYNVLLEKGVEFYEIEKDFTIEL